MCERINASESCTFQEAGNALESQHPMFLPGTAVNDPKTFIKRSETTFEIRKQVNCVEFTEKYVSEEETSKENPNGCRHSTKLHGLIKVHTRPQKKRTAKSEEQFRKATFLILCSLFFCNVPNIIYNFYSAGTGDHHALFSYLIFTSLLLNSSLNALILIATSKEIQRNIKALFQKG